MAIHVDDVTLTDDQKANLREWVAALRSGEYEQTKRALWNPETIPGDVPNPAGYCCMGVLCRVKGIEWGEDEHGQSGFIFEGAPIHSNHPRTLYLNGYPEREWWREQVGDLGQAQFSHLNDVEGASFADIADYIEANYLTEKEAV